MPLTPPTNGRTLNAAALIDGLTPSDILYEAEAPIVFTLTTKLQQQMLAYLADENEQGSWFVLAPCGIEIVLQLRTGVLPLRDALCASWIWLAKLSHANDVTLWAVEASEIPDEYLPTAGTTLYPEHEPVLSTRAIGETIVAGSTPASVVAYVADATRKAIKSVG